MFLLFCLWFLVHSGGHELSLTTGNAGGRMACGMDLYIYSPLHSANFSMLNLSLVPWSNLLPALSRCRSSLSHPGKDFFLLIDVCSSWIFGTILLVGIEATEKNGYCHMSMSSTTLFTGVVAAIVNRTIVILEKLASASLSRYNLCKPLAVCFDGFTSLFLLEISVQVWSVWLYCEL